MPFALPGLQRRSRGIEPPQTRQVTDHQPRSGRMKRSTVSPGPHRSAALPALTLVLMLAPGNAPAQPAQNTKEAVQDRVELSRDKRQIADDVADVRRFEQLLLQLD